MNKDALLVEILRLPEDERRALVEKVSESFSDYDDEFELTPEQIAECERRIEEHERDPSSAIPWEEVRARLWARHK